MSNYWKYKYKRLEKDYIKLLAELGFRGIEGITQSLLYQIEYAVKHVKESDNEA